MKSFSRGDIGAAVRSLRSSRSRSILTIFGIVIGISATITIVSIGDGIKNQIADNINNVGRDLIIVRPDLLQPTNAVSAIVSESYSADNSLTTNDLQLIESLSNVQYAAPLSLLNAPSVKVGNQTVSGIQVVGTTNDIVPILNQSLQYGNSFGGNGVGNDAILGQGASVKIFGTQVSLGRNFNIDGQSFFTRGEFGSFYSAPLSIDLDFNNVIFIPYSSVASLQGSTASTYEILVKPTNPSAINAVVTEIESSLTEAHGGVQNFSVLQQKNSLTASDSIVSLLTNLIAAAAGIALFVGGIGIMNMMLVTVSERTGEIGVRKAVGATNRQILRQFLMEAIVLSVSGGIIGVVVALLINVGLRISTSLEPTIPWSTIVLATGLSLVIGIVFGLIPAAKAARKDPIDALRHQ
jgi:ABC-type antimicrobial peptide transport system permease subunit